jgi:exodeoxyribonuclease V alpha subunit
MQLRNNYDKNVFNGDMGRIAAIDRENQVVRVEYPAEGSVASAQSGTIPGIMREPVARYRPYRRRAAPAPAKAVRHSLLGPVAEATYEFAELDELTLAYAVSAHKAQGSEFPAIVIVLGMSHYTMLQRNLLYTAITRARQLCVVIASPRALQRAVENNAVAARYSGLAPRLRSSVLGLPAEPTTESWSTSSQRLSVRRRQSGARSSPGG